VITSLVVVLEDEGGGDEGGDTALACAKPKPAAEAKLMNAYAGAGKFPAGQRDDRRGLPRSVSVEIPPIEFTGEGRSSTLPVGPCQNIYRFRYRDIRAGRGGPPAPFRYVEIDWNTEGKARGPMGSFVSPHFDFHYYLEPKRRVFATTGCGSSNGRTCDPALTPYAQMRRFLKMPPAASVPALYEPDPLSSIPYMGLHLLDGEVSYSVDEVNHNPTLFYGSFDGRLLFAEASVTLFTLQDAMESPDRKLSFPYRQPLRMSGRIAWPTRFTVTYEPARRTFAAAFEDFRR
jgi:hypothetical protein